jgi:hypothetical protein
MKSYNAHPGSKTLNPIGQLQASSTAANSTTPAATPTAAAGAVTPPAAVASNTAGGCPCADVQPTATITCAQQVLAPSHPFANEDGEDGSHRFTCLPVARVMCRSSLRETVVHM